MNIEIGTIISNRYKVLEKIGEGGMAKVYRCEDIMLKRDVTLKVLKEEFVSDDEFKKRFTVEARAAAGLSHPNIVTVFDVGNDGSIYYIVMEYVNGFTLKELITKKAPFENEEALGIAIHIASALEAAHSHGVIHRDIKPHNILIAKDGSIKVTDFGIARATSATTLVTDGLGSVHYFSPEQARGGYVDEKTDIYSLGIVLYEMVTGKLPFEGENAVQLAMKHISQPLPDMLAINPKISKSVEKIIKKATAKNTTGRYNNIEEFNNDLKRAMNNPTGSFVNLNPQTDNSQTIIMTAAQKQEINKIINDGGKPKEFVYGENHGVDWQNYVEISGTKEDENIGFTPLPDEQYEKNPQKSGGGNDAVKKKITIAAAITGGVICAAIAAVVILLVSRNIKIERQVVPNLMGVYIEDAVTIANTNSLYVVKSDEYSIEAEDYDEDYVYKQSPEAGSNVKTGDTITVFLGTKQRQEIEMPIFVKSYLSTAEEEAEELGIKIEVGESDYETSSKYEEDYIYKQEPEYGEIIYVGSTVTVYVGTGEDVQEERESESSGSDSSKVVMRRVVGKSAEEARAIIEDLGLYVNIVEAYSSTYDKGIIIRQGYEGGESVEKGKTVTLVSSLGPEPVSQSSKSQTSQKETSASDEPVIEEAAGSDIEEDEENIESSENTDSEEEENPKEQEDIQEEDSGSSESGDDIQSGNSEENEEPKMLDSGGEIIS